MRTLTSIMSSTGEPGLAAADAGGDAGPDVADADRPGGLLQTLCADLDGAARPGSFPLDEARDLERAEAVFDRGLNPAGVARQLAAVVASGSRKEALAAVKAPTLVIHGDADPLVRLEAGEATARAVPGAKL